MKVDGVIVEKKKAKMRLIDANSLTDIFSERREHFLNRWGGYSALLTTDKARVNELNNCIALVNKASTVDAVEVVHGRWIEKIDMVESYLADSTEVFYECSVCECANIGESPYCPNCGAKMDGVNEDG